MDARDLRLTDLIEQCAAENQRLARGLPHDDRACVEIFRRALVEHNDAAWAALRADYGPLARAWLARHPLAGSLDDATADQQALDAAVFERFRQLVPPERFAAVARLDSLLGQLKLAVFATLIDAVRAQQVAEVRSESAAAPSAQALWQVVESVVPEATDRLALYLTCALGLRPVEIARRNPHRFASSRAVTHHLLHAIEPLWQTDILQGYRSVAAAPVVETAPAGQAHSRPDEVSDTELLGFALGERPRRMREHLQACPRCRALAGQYESFLRYLTAVLYRFDCPVPAALGEHYLRALPAVAMTQVGAHLSRCPHCAAEEASAAGFLDTADRAALGAIRSAAREVEARLVPEASREPRGRRPATLVFATDELRLTLHPQAAERRGQVQLLGFAEQPGGELASLAGARVRLLEAGEVISTTTIDDIGTFTAGPVAPGDYTLEVAAGAQRVIIPRLALTASRHVR